MHSSYYNENFYDFTIDINEDEIKLKNEESSVQRLKCFHHYEYLRAKEFMHLHEAYDKKFNELFYMEKAPKDSLNRFLYEQLSLKNDQFESFMIQKPKNIYKMETFKIEIISNYPLTKPMRLIKHLNRYRTLKDINEFIQMAEFFVKLVDKDDERYVNRYVNSLKDFDKQYCQDIELHNEFDRIYNKCLPYFKPIVKRKAKKIIDFMYDEIKHALKSMKKQVDLFKNSSCPDDDEKNKVEKELNGDTVSLKYKDAAFTILSGHYEKLKKLYKKNTILLEKDIDDFDKNDFLSRVYCVLSRYETFFRNSTLRNEGYGMQGALPNYTFKELNKEFNVKQEMFASPLNCYFSKYCSAFADTDVYFGSCGSFFDYEPIEGSFQANPPFTEEVIERMAIRIDKLLEKTDLPLSFIVFIPEWLDPPTPGLVRMNNSIFKTRDFIVPGQKHKYVAGTQFLEQRGRLLYSAIHDTHVYFLQNKAGYEKWMPTDTKIESLKRVMIVEDEFNNFKALKRKFTDNENQSLDTNKQSYYKKPRNNNENGETFDLRTILANKHKS